MTDWFRVEVSDHDGQIVAIEPDMLAGRDLGDKERAIIRRAIEQLQEELAVLRGAGLTLAEDNKRLRDELTVVMLERDALKREHTHMRTALEWLRDNWYPSHNHWDAEGTSGTNCRQCHSDTAARQAIRAGLCAPMKKELLDREAVNAVALECAQASAIVRKPPHGGSGDL